MCSGMLRRLDRMALTSQETAFFIVTAVKITMLQRKHNLYDKHQSVFHLNNQHIYGSW
jgi:hypothetical protein